LADLYRRILEGSKRKTGPLGEELETVRRYLELESIRFGRRLAFTIDAEPSLAGVEVPSLALQTFVENALKHGLARSREGGHVAVAAARLADGAVLLSVANTGAPIALPVREGTGLSNTRERLDLLYGERHRFAIGADGGRTVAS